MDAGQHEPLMRAVAFEHTHSHARPRQLTSRSVGADEHCPGGAIGGLMLFDRKGYLVKADTRARLTLAAIGIEPNGEPPLRIDALDTSDPKPAANVELPDWLRPEWMEPVIEVGHRLGTIVALPARPTRSALLPAGGLPRHKLRQIMDLIEAHLDQPIGLEHLAAVAGVSPFHFHRQFKKSTGLTPRQYILQKRIERAKALLSESQLPLAEIAAQIGFADQSHFTTAFRLATSMTPRTYRLATSA